MQEEEGEMTSKMLIVDDEIHLVRFLQQTLLLEFPDSRVDVAYSGEEALSRLAQSSYDLILADLRMPGFDGLELIRGVRYLNPQVPIILMTGYGTGLIREEAAKLGVDHYVDKPFEVGTLLQTVQHLLAGGQGR
jgi:two-component system response regulator PilR (NtrC family)